jgi:high-affinity K+ transport system ATPase subunit B
MKKFSVSEILILVVCVVCIFVSEYIYLVQDNILKAIFIGLWPPTILGLLNFINIKRK